MRTLARTAATAALAAGLILTGASCANAGFVPDPSPTYQPTGTDHATATGSAKVSTCFLGICF
jgi:hypothetical protein